MQPHIRANRGILALAIWMVVAGNVLSLVLILLGFDLLVTLGTMQVVSFGLPFAAYLLFTKQSPRKLLALNGLSWKNALTVTLLTLFMVPAVHLIAFVSSYVFVPVVIDFNLTLFPLWMSLLVIGVFPSIFEEIWFRGVMYTEYQAAGIPLRKIALVTALFFGLMHMNFHQAIYAGLLGIVWAYMIYYTRSILAPMLAHFINNGLTAALQYVDSYVFWYDDLFENSLMFLLIVGGATLVTLPIAYFCMKRLKQNHANTTPPVEPQLEPTLELENPTVSHEPKAFSKSLWVALGVFVFMCVVMELILRFF